MIKLIIIILISLIVLSALIGFYLYISELLTTTANISINIVLL
jgi:Tfp pilus assembly protein PilW